MPGGNNPVEEASGGRRSRRIATAATAAEAAAANKGKDRDKAPAKVAPKGKPGKSTTPVKKKRGRNVENAEDEDEEGEKEEARAPKRQRKAAPAAKAEVIINQIPEQELDVYVWGCGNFNELGMLDDSRDPDVPARNVKHPLKNPLLSGPHGITHVAVGSRHGAALVKTPENNGNKILTWGSNQYGALGRTTDERPRFATTRNDWERHRALPDSDTKPEWKPSIVDVDVMGKELRFSQLACGAETTFALTDTGDVYGWGCFMKKVPLEISEDYKIRFENIGANKLVGFSENTLVQEFPIRLPELKNIKSIAAGDNHVLALDANGKLYVWGSDEHGQLGHRRMARRDKQYLKPALFRQRNTFQLIGTGRNHSFAIQEKGRKVWGWGQNDYCQTGTENKTGVEWIPASVPALSALSIDGKFTENIAGTDIGSIASISDGNTLVWGCLEPNVTGLDPNSLDPAKIIRDSNGRPVMLITPTQLKRTAKSPTFVTGGRTHSILVQDGSAFSWGKNTVYECGQGHTDNIVKPTELITAREGELRNWVWAGAGHQFGMLASHTRITQKWERSRNELRSPASTTDEEAGQPAKNASSGSVSDETLPSEDSSASGRDGQVEPSNRYAESSSEASRARINKISSEPVESRIVSRNILVAKKRESHLRLTGDEESPQLELQPGSRNPRSRGQGPKVVGPVVGSSRLTGPGRPRPIIEVRPIKSSSDYSERSLGPKTPSTPTQPGPQRDAEIQWGPQRDDIDELDSAILGWGPQDLCFSPYEGNSPTDDVLDEPERKRVPLAPARLSVAEGTQDAAPRERPALAPAPLPVAEETRDVAPRERRPLATASAPVAQEPEDIVRTQKQPSPQNPPAPSGVTVIEETESIAHTHTRRQLIIVDTRRQQKTPL